MKLLQATLVCVFSISLVLGEISPSRYFGKPSHRSLEDSGKKGYKYETKFINMQIDHFAFTSSADFQLRYLINTDWWGGDGAPIFFYTGNEGDITWFCNNTGFVWDIGPKFKAMIIFAEHRYYGKSLPFGRDSFKDPAHTGFLTAEQALADFAVLIDNIRVTRKAKGSPVIAFGGSYGGMLAAWFRMKYPATVQGSLAASAPVWQFGDLVPCNTFYKTTTDDFAESGPNCASNIKKSWSVINHLGSTESGRAMISKMMKLCNPLQTHDDVGMFKGWLAETWGNLAMVDYPYPASFLEPLPAWPIKVVCRYLGGEKTSPEEYIRSLYEAMNVYFNYTGKAQCFNISQQATGNLGDMGWGFQACTEMVMPMCSDGKSDMFELNIWNYSATAKQCMKQWRVEPRPKWIINQFGGKDISAASNIIFSNGRLDPWSGGGVRNTSNLALHAILIHDGAHHLDLRSSNPADPQSVIEARKQEEAIISKWITQYHERKNPGSTMYKIRKGDVDPGPYSKLMRNMALGIGALLGATVVFMMIMMLLRNRKRQHPELYSNLKHEAVMTPAWQVTKVKI